jgi:ATP-dependent exoDNAse (exonuclease V) beta subunit
MRGWCLCDLTRPLAWAASANCRVVDAEQDQKLFYVALTRATEFLAIVHSGHSAFVNEAYAALKKYETIG